MVMSKFAKYILNNYAYFVNILYIKFIRKVSHLYSFTFLETFLMHFLKCSERIKYIVINKGKLIH